MSQYERKRHSDHSQAFEPHKRHKAWTHGAEEEVQSANDRFASSVYKGRTLINKTPQKITFNEDAPAAEKSTAPASSRLSRKKSVTFTPETKNEDGATGQNFSKMWLAPATTSSSIAESPTPTKAAAPPTENGADSPKTKPQLTPRPKKTKKGSQPQDENASQEACLAYLDLFHKDHANWKFNKARQNDLLRHIWDTERIPTSYNDALFSYMKGFTGSAAMQRLADQIVAMLDPLLEQHKEALETISTASPESRRNVYTATAKKQRHAFDEAESAEADGDSLKDLRTETEKAERAVLLMQPELWKLLRPAEQVEAVNVDGTKEKVPETAPPPAAPPAKPTVSRRKSRKSRTATYSSSESSSSDSDSDSDSD